MANHIPCGIELPQVFFDGPVDMEHIRNFAIKAETLGYDSLWLQERVIGDFAMLGAGDAAQLRRSDHDESEIGHIGHSLAAAKPDSIGEGLFNARRNEPRPRDPGRRSRRRPSGLP